MILLRPFFFLICFVLFGMKLIAQDFPMLHYTVEDGLPSNTIYNIYRDSKGFLWFATDKGVARYNGIKFEKFSTFDGLPDNEIFFFQEDIYGRLWLATYNGELCYYKDGIFHTAANTPFLRLPFKSSFINQIAIENDSSVTFVFNDETKFINLNHEHFDIYDLHKLNSGYRLLTFLFPQKISPDRYKLIFSDTTMVINKNFEVYNITGRNYKKYNGLSSIRWHRALNQGQYYTLNENYIFNKDMEIIKAFAHHFTEQNGIYQLYNDGENILIATQTGLFLNDSLKVLLNNKVSAITQDKCGNYWAGTLENGAFLMEKKYSNGKVYPEIYHGAIKYFLYDKKNMLFITSNNDIDQLKDGRLNCLFCYKKVLGDNSEPNTSYLIDQNYNCYYYNNSSLTIVENILAPLHHRIKKYIAPIYSNSTFNPIIEKGAQHYFNFKKKIAYIDFAESHHELLQYHNISDSISRIFGMAISPDSCIWYSNIKGVYKIVNKQSELQPQFKQVTFKSFDFYNYYLIGYTHNNQLILCKNYEQNIQFDSIPPQNCIWNKFYRLDSNHILISTDNLYRLLTLPSKDNPSISVWPVENPYIPQGAEAVCPDSSKCYFFKNGSVTVIEMNSLLTKPSTPELFFSFLRSGKKVYQITNEIEIPFKEAKSIKISFLTSAFGAKKVFYQYSFSKNKQDNWEDLNGEEINLVNSGYGDYEIKVRAKTMSSSYCTPIVFTLHILPPYWASWWFMILCACIVIAIIALLLRYRVAYVLRKKERAHDSQLRFMKLEYKALNALMNPHFIFNTLNNVQSLFNENNRLGANEYLRVFADLVRQNMQNISKELISLQKEIDLVNNYLLLEKLRFGDKLNYTFDIEEGLDLSCTMIPPLLIQPLVENSIKHGILPLKSSVGVICIRIYEQDKALYIEVRDNGIGLGTSENKKNATHESVGLESVRKRILQLSIMQRKEILFNISTTKDENGHNKWTIATISLPFSE